jgi:hypothetical protein
VSVAGTLTERLGYGPDSRLFIVNCDDLGSSHGANVATLKAMDVGSATSATLMVVCPWAREAARLFQGRDVGVHLTLTCEYPGYRWRSLTGARSLHDEEGFLPATSQAAAEKADPSDVRAECRAQIEQALAWGIDVTHLDAHMATVWMSVALFEIYLDLAAEYRLPVRLARRRDGQAFGYDAHAQAEARGVLFPDRFMNGWQKDLGALLTERIPALRAGVSEVCAHPVMDGEELRAYDPDAPDQRANDAAFLTQPIVRPLMETSDVVPISFRPLRDLQRRGV